jgi:hypothetical protein
MNAVSPDNENLENCQLEKKKDIKFTYQVMT